MGVIYKIWICVIGLIGVLPLYAVPQPDSLYIYFRRGYAVVEPSMRENRSSLEAVITMLNECKIDTSRHFIKLQLKGNASPDGTASANMRLTRKRVVAVQQYLRKQIQLSDSSIIVVANGIDWDGLAVLVEKDAACPAREEVLDILNNTPEWIYDAQNRIVDGRRKRLMDLRSGVPYNYMAEKFFPDLRNATLTLYYDVAEEEKAKPEPTVMQEPDSLSVSLSEEELPSELESDLQSDTGAESELELVDVAADVPDRTSVSSTEPKSDLSDYTSIHRMALKTNLLYDAILMPSLEVEYRIDDRWSVAVEGSVAWWKRDRKHKYYQIATILPEGRYWFRTKKPWHGHYVGLFAGGSWYDLENGARGYKGEFFTTGISYGYMFPIGRVLSLETGLGVGFLHTTYEEYLPIDGHYVYQQTSRTNWIGPVKVKFALVWRLWDQKQGGAR